MIRWLFKRYWGKLICKFGKHTRHYTSRDRRICHWCWKEF